MLNRHQYKYEGTQEVNYRQDAEKFFNSFYINFYVGSGSIRNVVYGSEILAVLCFSLSPCSLFF
jgi:hypothetical protein